jgi:hypothetical protein
MDEDAPWSTNALHAPFSTLRLRTESCREMTDSQGRYLEAIRRTACDEIRSLRFRNVRLALPIVHPVFRWTMTFGVREFIEGESRDRWTRDQRSRDRHSRRILIRHPHRTLDRQARLIVRSLELSLRAAWCDRRCLMA